LLALASSEFLPPLAPSLIGALAFGVRIYRLDGQSLWFDEGFALHLASKSVPEIIEQTPVGWLPLHSLLLHFWLAMAGETPFAARFFSVFFGVLVVAILYLLGRTLSTARTGIIAAVLGAFSPFLVYYSQETRAYALWLFLTLLSAYLLLRAIRRPEQMRGWVQYGIVAVLALYTHYFSLFVIGWGLAALLYEAVASRRWRALIRGGCAQLAALLAYIPLIGFARSSMVDPYGFWRSPLSALQVLSDLWYQFVAAGNVPREQSLLAMAILAILGIIGLVSFRRPWNGVVLALYFVIPVWGQLLLSSWREFYVARYVAIAAPAAYLLAARGLDRIWAVSAASGRILGGLALAAFLCSVGVLGCSWAQALRNYYYCPDYGRDDFRSAARFVSSGEGEEDVIVLSGGGIFTAFLPYYAGSLPWIDLPSFGEWLDEQQVVDGLNGLLEGRWGGRVWLVLSGNQITDPQNLIVAHLWTYGQAIDARGFPGKTGVRVLVFSPRQDVDNFSFAPLAYETVGANFDNLVMLVGFDIDDAKFEPGDDIHLALKWQAFTHLSQDYHAFVHVLDSGNLIVAGHDKVPLNEYFRPTAWPVGEPLRDEYVLTLPEGLPAGTYEVEAGLYSYPELERVPVVGDSQRESDRVLLPPIIVEE
jgi:mannosyltransferase